VCRQWLRMTWAMSAAQQGRVVHEVVMSSGCVQRMPGKSSNKWPSEIETESLICMAHL
jgi:hypothetical protein